MLIHQILWNPDPEFFNICGFSIRYYGLLFALGLFFSHKVLDYIFKSENISPKYLDLLTIYGVVGIFLGARLGHCLFYNPQYYLSHPIEMFFPLRIGLGGKIEFTGYQGLASHGGAIGLIISLYFFAQKTKQSFLQTLDYIAISTGVAAGFIRIANFVNSEIVGTPASVPWAITFSRVDLIPRHPTQLYEAIIYFLIFLLLFRQYQKKSKKTSNGFFFGWALMLIFTSRFLIEFVKVEQASFENGLILKMGQLLSLPPILVGIAILLFIKNKN